MYGILLVNFSMQYILLRSTVMLWLYIRTPRCEGSTGDEAQPNVVLASRNFPSFPSTPNTAHRVDSYGIAAGIISLYPTDS